MSKQEEKPREEVIEKFIDRKQKKREYTWAQTCKRSAWRFDDFIEQNDDIEDMQEYEFGRYDLEDFIIHLEDQPEDWSPEGIKNMVFAVRELLKYAYSQYDWNVKLAKGVPDSIYSDDLELPTGLQMEKITGVEIPYVRKEEYEAMLDECTNFRDEVIMRTLWDTGCRPKELRELRLRPFKNREEVKENLFQDAKIEVETAKRRKNDDDRYLFLSPRTRQKWVYWLYKGEREAFSSCSHTSSYVFPTERTEKMKKGTINRQIKRWADRADVQEVMYSKEAEHKLHGEYKTVEREFVRINSKSFRHAFAVRACRNGIALPILADLMGHQDTESLKHYTKFYPDDLKEAWEQYTRD